MVLIRTFLVLALIAGCAPARDSSGTEDIPPPRVNCPEGGDCSFEVLQHSTLTLKSDDIGMLYPVIEKGDGVVLRYHYKKDTDPNDLDGSYSEYVLMEIDSGRVELGLRDEELQKVKMTFGRICYCKGEMGYFPVRDGQLFLYQKDGKLQLKTSFRVSKVPQIVKEIDEELTYYPK
jgi:hypothetical protein